MIIAGPCMIESEALVMHVATTLARHAETLGCEIVFKASFDKANRTAGTSARGPGIAAGLAILDKVKRETGLRTLTDIHDDAQAAIAGAVVDVLQIPAFLSRQTSLIAAAAATGCVVNIKKGQFLAPDDMAHAVAKARGVRADAEVWLTERGTSFGYRDLVVDFRSLAIMARTGCPVVFDASHAVQRPGAGGGVSGGDRAGLPALVRAAAAAGADALFIETHPDPANALSDAATSWPLDRFGEVAEDFLAFRALAAARPRPEAP